MLFQVIKVSQLNLRITSRMTFNVSSYYPSWALLERIYTDIGIEEIILSMTSLVSQTLLNLYTGRLLIGDHQCPA